MKDFTGLTEDFIARLKETEEYKNFMLQQAALSVHPDMRAQVDEYRERSFRLQNETDPNRLFDEVDNFEREFAQFRKNPIASAYLDAELAYCRMTQEVCDLISAALAAEME